MHQELVTSNDHAVVVRHALVSKTDSQHRDASTKVLDHVSGHPRFFGSARTWGDDDMRRTGSRVQSLGLLWSDLIMAFDHKITIRLKCPIDLTQSLDEIPSERVVVVNKQNHDRV